MTSTSSRGGYSITSDIDLADCTCLESIFRTVNHVVILFFDAQVEADGGR